MVVGIIGFVGIIAGQFVNAWREDRRWKREQAREDLRWQRELERQATERRTADLTHWRDKKFEIYNDFLSFMKRWRDLNYEVVHKVVHEGEASPESLDRLHRLDQNSSEHQDRIELMATDQDAQHALIMGICRYQDYTREVGAGLRPANTVQFNEFVSDNEFVIDVIRYAIRVDLGISDDSDREYLPLLDPIPKGSKNGLTFAARQGLGT